MKSDPPRRFYSSACYNLKENGILPVEVEGIKRGWYKMKRLASFLLILAFIMVSVPAFALPEPILKFKDGFVDVISSPLEIKDHAVTEVKDSHYNLFGLVGGLLKGSVYMVKKSITGAMHMATFAMK